MDELLIGVLAKANLRDEGDTLTQREMTDLIQGLKNNRPDLVEEMRNSSAVRQKRGFRRIFGDDGDSLRHAGWGLAALGPLAKTSINRFSIKLAQALYYYHVGDVFHGNITTRHNSRLLDDAKFFDPILEIAPNMADPMRERRSLSDQFNYRYSHSVDIGALIALVEFNPQLIITIMAVSSEALDQMGEAAAQFAPGMKGNTNTVAIPRPQLQSEAI